MTLMSGPAAAGGGATAAAISCAHRCPLKSTNPIAPLFSRQRRPRKYQSTSTATVPKPLTVASAEPTAQTTADTPPAGSSSGGRNTSGVDSNPITLVGQGDVPLEGVIQFENSSSSTAVAAISKWGRVALLAGGDVLALVMFSAIGRFSHGFPVFDLETLKTADPFIAGWFLGAYFLGGFGEDGRGMNGKTNAITAAAKSWAVGIPIGMLIRAASLGRVPAANFVGVTMGSTAVLLIGWRALLSSLIAQDKKSKDDAYRRGNPFELFELLTSLVRRW